jgi:hypothetical protein
MKLRQTNSLEVLRRVILRRTICTCERGFVASQHHLEVSGQLIVDQLVNDFHLFEGFHLVMRCVCDREGSLLLLDIICFSVVLLIPENLLQLRARVITVMLGFS